MRKINFCFILFYFLIIIDAESQVIASPDKNIKLHITVGKQLFYSIAFKDKEVLKNNVISMTLSDGKVLGIDNKISKNSQRAVTNEVHPLYGMASEYNDVFNELSIQFKNNFSVTFRVYNSGVAYRFETRFPGTIHVKSEQAEFNFVNTTKGWFQSGKGFGNFYEDPHVYQDFSLLKSGVIACLPFLADTKVKTAVLETDLIDYPGMLLEANGVNGVKGSFPRVVLKDSIGGGGNFQRIPYEYEDFIAKTKGTRSFPWRIMVFAENDKDLLYNNLTYLLASESKLTDASWIKPGKVAWDWYNANNLTGVDFKTGYNTNTYKYYIDFAARNGLEYVMLDEGWSDQFDLLKLNDGSVKTNDGLNLIADLDMPFILEYAKQKGVGVILWCVWHTLDRQMIEALDQFEKWGVKGVKVDFMSRDDQYVVNFYERLAKETAKRKMLVDFHAAFKPSGLERLYPNVINYEAAQGLEWDKFSDKATPENVAHIPFTRMLAGPVDYTPGGMHNASQKDFRISMQRPMTQGTRCHQLALFTILYAPFEMLADAPTTYEKEPIILKYLSGMPTVWDETIPIDGKVGDFATLARRKGTTWHIAGITDYGTRTVKVKFDFLSLGATYEAEIFEDGINSDRLGEDYKHTTRKVSRGEELEFRMMPGGGFAVKLEKK